MKFISIPFFFLALFLFTGCGSEEDLTEEEQIEKFIAESGVQFKSTASGLRYRIDNAGTGDVAQPGDVMIVYLQGFLLTNQVFVSNFNTGPETIDIFNNSDIIPGLKEGLSLLKNGEQGTFLLPSALAFGDAGGGNGVVSPGEPVGFVTQVQCIMNPEASVEDNFTEIEEYLADNGLTAEKTESGLYYIIEEEGDGVHPIPSSTVTVHYHGYLTDGTVFDSSIDRGTPAQFPLSGVIPGWQEGIPLFSKGGKGKLLIPHTLAYGCNPPTDEIPSLGVLIFDVELIDF